MAGPAAPAERRILHVDLDAFFVALEQLRDPALRGRPVIVTGDPDGRSVVSTASYEARRYGVHSAMPLVTALRLCPQAVVLRGDFPYYASVSRRFHAILRDFTPLVESVGLDEAYLDVTGCEAVSGPAESIAQAIRARVREELGITASVGVAGSKVVAKVASDAAKPDGLLVVPPGGEADFLAPLPVRDLPMVGPRLAQELRGLGIRTIGDLARWPEDALAARFGSAGRALARRARGIDGSPVTAQPEPIKSISRDVTFPRDVGDRARLRATAARLGERVGAALREDGRHARTVTLRVRYGDFTTLSRQRTLATPTNADRPIIEAALALLERALSLDPRPVRLLGVGVANLTGPERQLSFLEADVARWERLSSTLDAVRSRHGAEAVRLGIALVPPEARRGGHPDEGPADG
ncbi:MAG TPA: DNA polymerase IV [Dehalococcoidia bacterium]